MSETFFLNCAGFGANTGSPGCAVDLRQVAKVVLARQDFQFASEADFLDIEKWDTAIAEGLIFPLPEIQATTDNSAEAVTEEINGRMYTVKEGEYRMRFQIPMTQPEYKEIKQLEQRSGATLRAFLIDSQGNVLFAQTKTGGFAGFQLHTVTVPKPAILNDGTVLAKNYVDLAIGGDYMADGWGLRIGYYDGADILPEEVNGVVHTILTEDTSASPAAGEAAVIAKTVGGVPILGLDNTVLYANGVLVATVTESTEVAGGYLLGGLTTGANDITIQATADLLYNTEIALGVTVT